MLAPVPESVTLVPEQTVPSFTVPELSNTVEFTDGKAFTVPLTEIF